MTGKEIHYKDPQLQLIKTPRQVTNAVSYFDRPPVPSSRSRPAFLPLLHMESPRPLQLNQLSGAKFLPLLNVLKLLLPCSAATQSQFLLANNRRPNLYRLPLVWVQAPHSPPSFAKPNLTVKGSSTTLSRRLFAAIALVKNAMRKSSSLYTKSVSSNAPGRTRMGSL